MQANSPTTPIETDPSRRRIDHAELRAILSNFSRELSRPLVSLRAGFDLLMTDDRQSVSDAQRQHLRTMSGLCDDLLRLTRSYLDYAGLAQNHRPVTLGVFSMGSLVGEIERYFRPRAAEGQIAFACHVEEPEGKILTDASRFQQIVGSVVCNALKYSREDGAVRLHARREDGGWIVTVSDEGPGIPADHHRRVFEPYYRLPREEHSRIDGNGLGLTICREMVEQLGGEVLLDSALDAGTRVSIRFPARPECSASDDDAVTTAIP